MDNSEFIAENIEKALHQLYFNPSPESKDKAQRWLTSAQRSKQAWSFCWELLQPERKTEVQYFGASALVTKISGFWNEVPECEIESLRDRIFAEILRLCTSSENRIVLTRMCVAFASFVIKCVLMQRWPTAVIDIIKKLQDENQVNNATPMQRCYALLEILTVLAEEYHTKSLERYPRSVVKHYLAQGMQEVLPLLSNLLSSDGFKSVHGQVIKCFTSWIVIGISLDDNTDFLHRVFSCLSDSELFDDSVECLLQAFCAPEALTYATTIKSLIPKVLALRPMLHQAITDHDADTCLGLTKVVCGLAENQTKLIVENFANPEIGLGLVLMVTECTAINLQYPTEEQCSPIALTFWYSLQDEIKNLPQEAESALFPQVKPVYFHLVETLLKKASYPMDSSHLNWSSDEKEQHRIYRVDVSDSLMFVLELLGPGMIQFLCDKLVHTVNALQQGDNSITWQDIETVLFGIHSVIETTFDWDEGLDCLSDVAQLLPSIKVENLTLADTILCAIGALTEWLYYSPQHLPPLLSIVLPCIWTQELALTTVLTLKRITRECRVHMLPLASSIMRTAQDALMKGILKNAEVTWLMQSVGHVLSILPEDECIHHLESILMLHMHQLQALSEDSTSGPTKNSILHILDILKSLFSTLDRRQIENSDDGIVLPAVADQRQPVLLILEQITPILQEILSKWLRDVAIVSAICSLYDRAIRTLIDGFSPLLPTLCDTLAKIFENAPQTSVLELTQQVTLAFGADAKHEYPIGTLFRTIIDICRKMFEGGHANIYPDLAQGFMDLLAHIMKKNSNLFFKEIPGKPPLAPPDLNLLFYCGLATFSLPESESVKSASSFLLCLFRVSANSPAVQSLLDSKGKELYFTMMKAIGGQAARTVMDNVADVLHALCKYDIRSFTSWVHESQKTANFPCPDLEKTKKDVFYTGLLRSKTRPKFRELVFDFAIVCRGLHGTEYIAG